MTRTVNRENRFNIKPWVGLLVLALLVGGVGYILKITEPDPLELPQTPFAGKGTADDPFQIGTLDELVQFRDMVNEGQRFDNCCFVQTADLDLSPIENWTPIGRWDDRIFCGEYDGAGHTIGNLTIVDGGVCGFFAYIDGTVKNLGIESGSIEGAIVGGIASQAGERACIINCYNKAEVIGLERAAGIVDNSGGEVICCWNCGEINCHSNSFGGIAAVRATEIANCYSLDIQVCPQYLEYAMRNGGMIRGDSVEDDLIKAMNDVLLEYNMKQMSASKGLPFHRRDVLRYIILKDGEIRFAIAGEEPESIRVMGRNTVLQAYAVVAFAFVFAIIFIVVRIIYMKRPEQPVSKKQGDRQVRAAALKPTVSATSLVLLFAILLGGLCNNLLWYKTEGILSFISFQKQAEATIDVIALGSSLAGYSVEPEVFWRNAGISEYTLWTENQPFWGSYYYLIEALKTNKPQIVMLDVNAASKPGDYRTAEDLPNVYANTYGIKKITDRLKTIRTYADQGMWMDLLLKWPIYHTRFSEIGYFDFLVIHSIPPFDLKHHLGTEAHYGQCTLDAVEDAKLYTSNKPMYNMEEVYLLKIIDLCDYEDIDLVLFAAPIVKRESRLSYVNSVAQIARERGIPFLNYNLMDDETGFNISDIWIDNAHPNTSGARKISEHLCDYLTAHYDLPDHRGDARYSAWDDFSREHDNDYIRAITDTDDFLRELDRDDRTMVLVKCMSESGDDVEAFLKRAADDGLELSFLEDRPYGCWVVESTRDTGAFDSFEFSEGESRFTVAGKEMVLRLSEGREITWGGRTVGTFPNGITCIVLDPQTHEVVNTRTLL